MSTGSDFLDPQQTIEGDEGSSNDLTASSPFQFMDGSVPFIAKSNSGQMSPVRARTMKEYDQQIAELHKENFNLKLRIYFLEERMKTDWDIDSESLLKENIELKVEVESLKKDLIGRQELLKKASSALTSQSMNYQVELQQAKDSGIAEGQRSASKELDALKLCIEDLQKELNAKREQLESLHLHSRDAEVKLNDLLAINRQMDARWRQVDSDKKVLEARLEMLAAVEKEATEAENNGTASSRDTADEVVRKDRLIEQLRCALKAKDVIIQQVEEEKREAIQETTSEYQKQITQLQAKIQDHGMAETMDSLSSAGKSRVTMKSLEKSGRVTCDAETQTAEQTKLTTNLNEDQLLALGQFQAENEKLKKQIGRREKEVIQLMDQLDKADQSLKQKDQQLKELADSFHHDKQRNAGKILELDAHYKVLFDDAHRHSANQDEIISHLTQRLKHKDEQMEKLLQLSNQQDVTHMHTKITEIIREIQKENSVAHADVVNGNDFIFKTKMKDLEKELDAKTAELEAVRNELSSLHQTISNIEQRLSDELPSRMTQQQNSGFKEMENPMQFDVLGGGNVIKQLLDIISLRDRQCQGALDSGSMSRDPERISSSGTKWISGSHGPESSRRPNEIPSIDAKFGEKHLMTEASHHRQSPAKEPSGRAGYRDPSSVMVDKSFQTDDVLSSCEEDELFQLRTEIELLRRMVNESKAEQLRSCQDGQVSLFQKSGKAERPSPPSALITTSAVMDESGPTRSLNSPDVRHHRHSAKALDAHLNGHLTTDPTQDLADSLPRELRLLSPRSNISYLSVESSKRWTLDMDEDEMENPMSSGFLPASQMKLFQLLIPDESTLSSRSPDQLREIIRSLAKAVTEPRAAPWDGSQCASPSSIISLQTLEQQSNLLENHTDQSLMEFSLRRKQLEKRLEEKEGTISDVSGKLEEMSVALSQNRKELDAATKKNNELLLRLDEASRQLEKSRDTVATLEAELRRVGEELKSTERANDLLKEQIELNARVDGSSLVFNPELIVRLSKEVDRMKKERASMEKELDRKTADSDRRPLTPAPVVEKIDRSTSTENLFKSEQSGRVHHVGGDSSAVNEGGKTDHQNSYSAHKPEHDAVDGSAFTGHSAGDGKNDLMSGLMEEFTGRLSEGRKSCGSTKEARRSLIPVSLKSTKSLSLDEETDMCNRVKCVQLETRLVIMQSRIEDQSRQIAHYRDLLKEVGPARTPDAKRPSEPSVPNLSADRTRSVSEQDVSGKAGICRTKNKGDSPTMTPSKSPNNGRQKERNGEGVASKDGRDTEQTPSDVKAFDATQPSNVLSTPFDVTKASNLQEFVRLKSEVRRLKTLLDTRDSSRLNDTVQTNADGTFCVPEVSFSSGGSIPPPPPSGQPGAATEQLKRHFVEAQNHDVELLQYHLAKSQQNYDLLRRRLEELLEYLEKQLKMADSSLQSSALHSKLSDTRHLIDNLSQSFNASRDCSVRMSLPGHLMRPDLDSTSMIGLADEEYLLSTGRQSLYDASLRKDYTLSEEPSEIELERQALRQHVALLERECGLLEDHVRRKEVELEQRLHQKQLELTSVIAEAADLRSQAANLWMDVESLKSGLGEEKEMNCALKSELIELKQSNQSLQETSEFLRQKMEEVSQERIELVDENHQLQLALAEQETKVNDLERDFVESEARRVDELRHSKEDHLRQMADLELERNTLLTKIHLLTSEIQALKVEVVRERDRADTAEVAGKGCLEKMEDKDAMIQKLKELVKENQKMAEELRVELHRVNEDVQQKKLTIRRLSQKCQELQNSFQRLKPDDISLSEDTALPLNQQHAQGKEAGFTIKESISEKINGVDHSDPSVSGVHSGQMTQQFGDKSSSDALNTDAKNHKRSDFADRRPTWVFHESKASDHQPTISSGMVVDCEKNLGGVVFSSAGDETAGLPRKSRRGLGHGDGELDAVELRSQLKTAEEMVAVLKSELRICRRVNGSGSSAACAEDLTVREHLEEIKVLRQHLEQSLKKNDELRDNLSHQLRREGLNGEDRVSGLHFTETSELTRLTRDIETAQREVSTQKTRLNRLQSELKEQITQLESLETEKKTAQRKIDASKIKLESAQAEAQRLKMSLDENIELSRAMKLELKLMGEVKIDDKENKLALPLNPLQGSKSPSRLQLADLLAEMRQLRTQLEKAVENNDVLRRDLERASNSKLELLSEYENIQLRTEFSSVSRTDRLAKSSQNGVNDSQIPWTTASFASTRHSSDVYRRDLADGSALAENQSLYVVADKEVFEDLKLEVLRNQRTVVQLEKSIQAIHAEVIEDERKQDLCGLVQEMRSVVTEQVRLMALFWMLNLLQPDPNASYTAKAVETELLRKQLSDLKERYSRAKHAMKGAQQRLEANNRKKEEFFALQRNRKDQAIQEQITKTHQVLVQSRRNLESFHNQCGDQSS